MLTIRVCGLFVPVCILGVTAIQAQNVELINGRIAHDYNLAWQVPNPIDPNLPPFFKATDRISGVDVSDGGNVILGGRLARTAGDSSRPDSWWVNSSTDGTQIIATEDFFAPTLDNDFKPSLSFQASGYFALDDGRYLFGVQGTNPDTGEQIGNVVVGTPSSWSVVASSVNPGQEFLANANFRFMSVSDNGTWAVGSNNQAYVGDLSGNIRTVTGPTQLDLVNNSGQAIAFSNFRLYGPDGSTTTLFTPGEATPGIAGTTITRIDSIDINHSGMMAVEYGLNVGQGSALYLQNAAGDRKLIAGYEQEAPGFAGGRFLSGGISPFSTISQKPYLTNNNDVYFMARVTPDTGSAFEAFYHYDAQSDTLNPLAYEGMQTPGLNGYTIKDIESSYQVNDKGWVVFGASSTNGSISDPEEDFAMFAITPQGQVERLFGFEDTLVLADGQQFVLEAFFGLQPNGSGSGSLQEAFSDSGYLTFRANSTTWLTLQIVPEPSSLALLGLGGLALLGRRRR